MDSINRMSANPWILWGSFAAGFVLPFVFLFFLLLAAFAAWRAVCNEYEDVGHYWMERAEETTEKMHREYSHTFTLEPPLCSAQAV